MTYSGILMLVICAAAARGHLRRARFGHGRRWCFPALLVALVLTLRAMRGSAPESRWDCCSPSRTSGSPRSSR
jgi:hypothetical protein